MPLSEDEKPSFIRLMEELPSNMTTPELRRELLRRMELLKTQVVARRRAADFWKRVIEQQSQRRGDSETTPGKCRRIKGDLSRVDLESVNLMDEAMEASWEASLLEEHAVPSRVSRCRGGDQ